MTVIAQNTNVTYFGSGSVGPFSFNFPISTPAALLVIQNNAVLPSTSYIIVPINNNYDNGGLVTLNTALPVGVSLVLQRSTPHTQTSVFTDNLPQPMQQFEDALDKLTEIDQELAASIASITPGGSGILTAVTAGTGIVVTGTGSLSNPYIISTATGFGITSFTGSIAGELGQVFTNPAFAATYSGTPTAANITNTDDVNSPFSLTTPFTAAVITGTFEQADFTQENPKTTTFTLTATNGVTAQIATATITWRERIFAGLGTAGADSTITPSGTTMVLSTEDVLPSAALNVETVGQTFGPFSPSGQVIYLLLVGNAHTFTDAITGFPFAFNAPITVNLLNQYGITLQMYLYQSTNSLTGTFQPKVAS
jgi:hypothetical protein